MYTNTGSLLALDHASALLLAHSYTPQHERQSNIDAPADLLPAPVQLIEASTLPDVMHMHISIPSFLQSSA